VNEHIGQSPDEVDQLARLFADKAAQVGHVQQQITSRIDTTTWSGRDRERFQADWAGPAAGRIAQVAQALTEAHDAAAANAQQQRQASGVAS